MVTTQNIQQIFFDKNFIVLIINGQSLKVPLDKVSTRLLNANEVERNLYKVSPSGYGIHWPLIDEDLSVAELIKHA